LHRAFEEAVDDYLDACEKVGRSPQKPASGKVLLPISPDIHTAALVEAKAAGKSLNQWVSEVIGSATHA